VGKKETFKLCSNHKSDRPSSSIVRFDMEGPVFIVYMNIVFTLLIIKLLKLSIWIIFYL